VPAARLRVARKSSSQEAAPASIVPIRGGWRSRHQIVPLANHDKHHAELWRHNVEPMIAPGN